MFLKMTKLENSLKKNYTMLESLKQLLRELLKKLELQSLPARPGIVIGKKGADVEKLKAKLAALTGKEIAVNIKEERKPQLSGQLSAENVAQQLERRVAFRRAMKRVMQNAIKSGAKGIKVQVAGRLGGAEMARTEWYLEGRVPLHTLRARIDYGFAEGHTTYGCVGIKVWIFKGEVLAKGVPVEKAEDTSKPKRRPQKRRGN